MFNKHFQQTFYILDNFALNSKWDNKNYFLYWNKPINNQECYNNIEYDYSGKMFYMR